MKGADMSEDIDIPILESSDEPSTVNRLGAQDDAQGKSLATKLISSERVRGEIQHICNEFRPEKIDPGNEIGVAEIEVALSISTSAGVRLIGEATTSTQASLKIKILRK